MYVAKIMRAHVVQAAPLDPVRNQRRLSRSRATGDDESIARRSEEVLVEPAKEGLIPLNESTPFCVEFDARLVDFLEVGHGVFCKGVVRCGEGRGEALFRLKGAAVTRFVSFDDSTLNHTVLYCSLHIAWCLACALFAHGRME